MARTPKTDADLQVQAQVQALRGVLDTALQRWERRIAEAQNDYRGSLHALLVLSVTKEAADAVLALGFAIEDCLIAIGQRGEAAAVEARVAFFAEQALIRRDDALEGRRNASFAPTTEADLQAQQEAEAAAQAAKTARVDEFFARLAREIADLPDASDAAPAQP